MDTFAKLIFIVILAVFHTSSHSATYTPDFGELKLVDGDLHITRGNGTTSLMYPDAGLSKSIDVSTSKGNFPVPVEKSFPVVPAKVAKAATRFLKTLPAIGTAIAIYDTVCDLSDICRDSNGDLQYAPEIPAGYPLTTPLGVWQHPYYPSVKGATPELLCASSSYRSAVHYSSSSLTFIRVEGSGNTRSCIYMDKTFSPPKESSPNVYTITLVGSSCYTGYTKVGDECVHNSAPVPVTEDHWTSAETKLSAQPQQVAEALYNSDAPVPVNASTQSSPVTQQIAQTSTQTKDAQGNVTGTQVATTSVKVEDTSTASNVTYNVTETTTITNYNENNEITSTQTSTSDNQPPNKPPESETTLSFDDVPPDDLEQEDVDLDMPDYESWGEGTCPDDVDLGVYGLSISYQPVCDVAVDLRPFFLLLASVTAVYILSGVSTKD